MNLRIFRCLLLALVALPAPQAAVRPPVVWDSDFRGYVPVVDGIERPDLVVARNEGRVPSDPKRAARRAGRVLRRARQGVPGIPTELLPPSQAAAGERTGSWRWRRRVGITTTLQVFDETERPVEGARVYRYYDPSFYAVNQDADGARLVGFVRFLPAPNPALELLEAVRDNERAWADRGFAPVKASPPDFDHRTSPFVRAGPDGLAPALEYLGTTDAAGSLRVVSGPFNLRDERRFPHAVVPSALRVGFIVVREGYQPGLSERRFDRGGSRETRRIGLIRARDAAVFLARDFELTARMVDGIAARTGLSPDEAINEFDRLLERVDEAAVRVSEPWRAEARLAARGVLFDRLYRRAPAAWRRPLIEHRLAEAPEDAIARWRLALIDAELAGVSLQRGARFVDRRVVPDADHLRALLDEAVRQLEWDRTNAPGLLAVYPLLDELLARHGGSHEARRRVLRRGLSRAPFSPWLRGRLAAILLADEREAEAFDHLRWSTLLMPGLPADLALAEALAQRDWRRGLVERAGLWPFLATGRIPEDLYPRPTRTRPP